MSKQTHLEVQESIRSYLQSHGIADHMFYGPATDQYWNEPLRLVALNMEPYGYDGCGFYTVDRDVLIDWIYDVGKTGTKTTRYTLALMSVVLSYIETGSSPSPDAFRKAFSDYDEIEKVLDRTVYYNMRPNSNLQKAQDFDAIASVGSSDLGRLIWQDIRALDPHVLFVSGWAGLVALNALLRPDEPINFRESKVHPDGFLIQSIAHPSRPNYGEWGAAVEWIGQWQKGRA